MYNGAFRQVFDAYIYGYFFIQSKIGRELIWDEFYKLFLSSAFWIAGLCDVPQSRSLRNTNRCS